MAKPLRNFKTMKKAEDTMQLFPRYQLSYFKEIGYDINDIFCKNML